VTRLAAFTAGALTFTALAAAQAFLAAATIAPVLHRPGWSLAAGCAVVAAGLGGGILTWQAAAAGEQPAEDTAAAFLAAPVPGDDGPAGLPGHAESAAEITGLAEWLEDERAAGQPDAELLRIGVAAMHELADRIRGRAPAWRNS
jgi:hypothetical protein